MKVLGVLSLIFVAQASFTKEFLEGVLTGFQGTEVQLGDDCLDPKWMNNYMDVVASALEGLRTNDFIKLYMNTQELIDLSFTEYLECHTPELQSMLAALYSIDVKIFTRQIISHLISLPKEMKKVFTTDDPREAGIHLGKALHMFLDKAQSPFRIPEKAVTDYTAGFIDGIAETSMNGECVQKLPELTESMGDLVKTMNKIIDKEKTYSDLAIKLGLIYIVSLGLDSKCDLDDLKSSVLDLLSKEGVTQAFIRYGMNLKEIKSHQAKMAEALEIPDFYTVGYHSSGIFKIIINWELK